MNQLITILAGHSVVVSIILCALYLFSLPGMNKSPVGKVSCAALMLPLAAVQAAHVSFFMSEVDLLGSRLYVLLLGLIPLGYYFFSREILRLSTGVRPSDAWHVTVLLAVLFLPLNLAALTAFSVGCFYTSYIFVKILRLRSHIPRYRFEKFFFLLFFTMNLIALALGLSLQILDTTLFYPLYASAIGIALILITTALLVYPELLTDVLLASETVYAKSKLENIDVHAKRTELERFMSESRCFENENLTLNDMAKQLSLSAQQLSELVNSSYAMGFPRYVRGHRIDLAKKMLLDEPDASVLSISMATGFKSQSSFYTAFKEITDSTPAAYRKLNAM